MKSLSGRRVPRRDAKNTAGKKIGKVGARKGKKNIDTVVVARRQKAIDHEYQKDSNCQADNPGEGARCHEEQKEQCGMPGIDYVIQRKDAPWNGKKMKIEHLRRGKRRWAEGYDSWATEWNEQQRGHAHGTHEAQCQSPPDGRGVHTCGSSEENHGSKRDGHEYIKLPGDEFPARIGRDNPKQRVGRVSNAYAGVDKVVDDPE